MRANLANLLFRRRPSVLLFLSFLYCIFSGSSFQHASSFQEIHSKIFIPKCANSACHGGAFEPNLSTPFSAFNTLVFHPVTKNNAEQKFTYRVIPYDTTQSVLHERITNCCFVNKNDRMPQSRIGGSLPQSEIDLINKWILSGAPDIMGNIAEKPESPVVIKNSFEVSDEEGEKLNDSVPREDHKPYGSVLISTGKKMILTFEANTGETISNNTSFLLISKNADQFQNAMQLPLQNYSTEWRITIDPKLFEKDCTWYFRFRICEKECSTFPDENTPRYVKQAWSFKIISQ